MVGQSFGSLKRSRWYQAERTKTQKIVRVMERLIKTIEREQQEKPRWADGSEEKSKLIRNVKKKSPRRSSEAIKFACAAWNWDA